MFFYVDANQALKKKLKHTTLFPAIYYVKGKDKNIFIQIAVITHQQV